MKLASLFPAPPPSKGANIGLLLLRLVVGLAFMMHGWGKIQDPFNWMGPQAPTPGILQALAALSEFGGGLAWILGAVVPLASLGIFCTMAFATFFCVFSTLSEIRMSPAVPRQTSSFMVGSQTSTTSVPLLYSTTRVVVDTGPAMP